MTEKIGLVFLSRRRFTVGIVSVGIALCAVLMLVSVSEAQAPWPTPPPAQLLIPPTGVEEANIVPITNPEAPGASSMIVQPIPAFSLPRIPPLPETVFASSDKDPFQRVRIHIESASTRQTLQLVYSPIPVEIAPSGSDRFQALRAFNLRAFDSNAKITQPIIHRPWAVHIPLPHQTGPDLDPRSLLIARYDSKERDWVPLVTSHFTEKRFLSGRILRTGSFAIVIDTRLLNANL